MSTLGLDFSPALNRSILDPIHGIIRFSDDEMDIISHELFQRLHRIRQNGLLYFVFPSATNTRFEHSLGTVHIATSILNNILINSFVASKKEPCAVIDTRKAGPCQAINFSSLESEQLQYIFKTTRLAALVHDIGHGPFSHVFDNFSPTKKDISTLIKSINDLKPLSGIISYLEIDNDERVKHEIMSCIIFAYIYNSINGDPNIISDVASVILGKPVLCRDLEHRRFIPLMHDIVASSPADADRMDYLERDSKSFGVTYGLYDRGRLLKSFLAYKLIENGQESLRLGIKNSGLRAIENFIQARFQLYVQIYYHKTNRAINLMMDEILYKSKEKSISIFNYNTYDNLINLYRELSDERFLNILRGKDPIWQLLDKDINVLAENLFKRKLWKRIFEAKKSSEVKRVFGSLKDNSDLNLRLKLDVIDPKATKGLEMGAALLKRGADGIYQSFREVNWMDQSPIIKALAEEEKGIARIYLNSENNDEIKRLRMKALNL
jgi:HD superfamily phosphohydrolase